MRYKSAKTINDYMKRIYLLFFILSITTIFAQNIDFETITKPNFKVTGGINSNFVFFNSNQQSAARSPFSYLLSGNINISAFTFSIPLSYSFTNQGNNLGYSVPFNFNRLSISPKYKWFKAYIGDSNMSFSPYTLNGHPFRGFGFDLTPAGSVKFSAMGGQLFKAIEATDGIGGIPVFQRMGYGAKLGISKSKFKIDLIGFYAKDNINSIQPNFDLKKITPKENLVSSINLSTTVVKNAEINIEYAVSLFTDDSRAIQKNDADFISKSLNLKENTTVLKAVKANINYNIGKSKVGIGYERVDPNYRTLGALFFNNDLENISLLFARPFYKDKVNITANLGYQRDDIYQQKKEDTKRVVSSFNINYKVNKDVNISSSYSSFSTYTNKKNNQFDLINNPQLTPADTLDYRQLSQNANANISYIVGKSKNQNFNFNYSIAGQANEQGGIIRRGQASTVQNYNLSHTINFKQKKLSVSSSINYTLNTVGRDDNSSKGASLGISKKMFNDKLNSNLGVLYNDTSSALAKNNAMGLKLNSSISLYKKHNINLSAIQMFRNASNVSKETNTTDLNININYSYNF